MDFANGNERICKWVLEKSGGFYSPHMIGIALEENEVLQAGVVYENFTGEGGSILMYSRCDNPRAPNRKFYHIIFWYPFEQLKVKRCTVLVEEHNVKAIKLNEHLGFKREAIINDYFPSGNAIVYKMYMDECKFLSFTYNKTL